jgi:transcriptional regulator with XRE-family HTH domain
MFREMRHRTGLSLQALGAAIAVDPSTISRWETRKEFLQFMRFVQALHRLGTTPELFLGLRAPEKAIDPLVEFPQFATSAPGPLDQFRIAR